MAPIIQIILKKWRLQIRISPPAYAHTTQHSVGLDLVNNQSSLLQFNMTTVQSIVRANDLGIWV